MLAKRWRLVCWAPLFALAVPLAGANQTPMALEKFDAEDLSLSMTFRLPGSRELGAYVSGPDRYDYLVVPGNYLGKHGGKITRITHCRIFFTDLMPDGKGGYVEVQHSLRSSGWNDQCQSVRLLPTDVLPRDPSVVPAEVTKKLAESNLSAMRLMKEIDTTQVVAWFGISKEDFNSYDASPKVLRLVIFHKKSRAVDIISSP